MAFSATCCWTASQRFVSSARARFSRISLSATKSPTSTNARRRPARCIWPGLPPCSDSKACCWDSSSNFWNISWDRWFSAMAASSPARRLVFSAACCSTASRRLVSSARASFKYLNLPLRVAWIVWAVFVLPVSSDCSPLRLGGWEAPLDDAAWSIWSFSLPSRNTVALTISSRGRWAWK